MSLTSDLLTAFTTLFGETQPTAAAAATAWSNALGAIISWGSAVVPSGTILHYGGSSAPANWLLCDGSAVSRTTYAGLFAIIGTTFGAGDGSTTFNVPDSRGRMLKGTGSGAGLATYSLGGTGGAEAFTPAGTVASHTHTMGNHTHTTTATGSVSAHTHPLSANGQACINIIGSGQVHMKSTAVQFAQDTISTLGSSSSSGTSTNSTVLQGNTDSTTPTFTGNAVASGGPSTNTSDATAPAFTGSSGACLDPYLAVTAIIKT